MPRPPKPMTAARLERVARHYLERWFTARAHLRRILVRRVDKALAAYPGDREQALGWVDTLLDRLERDGRIDDARFAADRAKLLHRRGDSFRRIEAKLFAKGLARHHVQRALEVLGVPRQAADLRAAAATVRKRRMGAFREDPSAWRDRDLARLARAGFSYGGASRVLALPDRDAVEAVELELEPDW